jgi:hypothetical protein
LHSQHPIDSAHDERIDLLGIEFLAHTITVPGGTDGWPR